MDEIDMENRAFHAQRFLDDDLFIESLQKLEEEYTRLSIDGVTLDEREEARKYVKVVKAIPAHFQSIVNQVKYKDTKQ